MQRRAEAGIPAGVRFASKIALAERMLARAFDAATPARWVVADSFYGRSGPFRRWREERDQSYAVMIPRTNAIEYRGRRIRVEQLVARLSESDPPAWLCLALSEECAAGMGRWLLIRVMPMIRATMRTGSPTAQRRQPGRSWCGCATRAGR